MCKTFNKCFTIQLLIVTKEPFISDNLLHRTEILRDQVDRENLSKRASVVVAVLYWRKTLLGFVVSKIKAV